MSKATSVRGITLTAAHLGSFVNFAQLACMAKFKIEPKCAAVKVTPLTEVALVRRLVLSVIGGGQGGYCPSRFCRQEGRNRNWQSINIAPLPPILESI